VLLIESLAGATSSKESPMPKLTVMRAAGGWWYVMIGEGLRAHADRLMYSNFNAAAQRASMIREGWI